MANIYDSKFFDSKGIEAFQKSFVREFKGSSTLNRTFLDSGFKFTDSDVTLAGNYLEVQLTHVIPRVLKREFPDKPALSLFSVSNEGTLAQTLVRRMKSFSGGHTREHDNKSNPNKGNITVAYDATAQLIETFEATSSYKELDLLRAARMNDPLDASLFEAHDESYKTLIDRAAFTGIVDEAGNYLSEGLLTRTDYDTDLSVSATGVFSGLTGVQMYNDIKGLWAKMVGKTGGVQSLRPDTLVTSPAVLSLIESTTYGTGGASDFQNYKTVGQMIRETLGITEIRATNRASLLDGTGTTDRLCLFNRQPDNMTLYVPMPLTFSEVLKQKFNYTFDSMCRVAGLAINRKMVFGYLKGC